jgi:hypothetical protein
MRTRLHAVTTLLSDLEDSSFPAYLELYATGRTGTHHA